MFTQYFRLKFRQQITAIYGNVVFVGDILQRKSCPKICGHWCCCCLFRCNAARGYDSYVGINASSQDHSRQRVPQNPSLLISSTPDLDDVAMNDRIRIVSKLSAHTAETRSSEV